MSDSTGKEVVYAAIDALITAKTGKRIGKTGGHQVFDLVIETMIAEAVKNGPLRLNRGFGSLHLRKYKAGTRKLPSGKSTTFGDRQKLRYEEGVMTAALVKAGGDLEAAKKAHSPAAAEVVLE